LFGAPTLGESESWSRDDLADPHTEFVSDRHDLATRDQNVVEVEFRVI
jgi:hypothetical protein